MRGAKRTAKTLLLALLLLGKVLVIVITLEWRRLLVRIKFVRMKYEFKHSLLKYSLSSQARSTLLSMYEETLREAMPPSFFKVLRLTKPSTHSFQPLLRSSKHRED